MPPGSPGQVALLACTLRVLALFTSCNLLQSEELVYLTPETGWKGDKLFVRYSNDPAVILDLERQTKTEVTSSLKRIEKGSAQKLTAEGGWGSVPRSPFLVQDQVYFISYGSVDAQEKPGESTKKGLATVSMVDRGQARTVATYTFARPSARPFLFPLDHGKWFAVDVNGAVDGRPTDEVFFLLKADREGNLGQAESVDSGLGALLKHNPLRLALRAARPVVFTDSHAILCLYEFGLFWSIRLRDGQVSGPLRLYNSITDERITKGLLLRPVVNLQPTRDGLVLVAVRPEESVLQGGELIRKIYAYQDQVAAGAGSGNLKDAYRSVESMWGTLYATYPFVHWVQFNPVTGGFKRLNPPPFGAKEMIHSKKEMGDFFWILDAHDNLRFLDRGLSEFKAPPPPAPPAAPTPAADPGMKKPAAKKG